MLHLGVRDKLIGRVLAIRSTQKCVLIDSASKIGSVRPLATKSKAKVSKVDPAGVNPSQYQALKIRSEVINRFKRQMEQGENAVVEDDPNAFWPNREVHLGKEFPNLFRPLETTAIDTGRVKVIAQADLPQKSEDSSPPVTPIEVKVEPKVEPKIQSSNNTKPAVPAPTVGEKIVTKSEPRPIHAQQESEVPIWAKTPIAVPYLKFDKVISEKDLPPLSDTFDALKISKSLADAIASEWNITRPSEIQKLTIPEFLKGSNILCAAQTGTGKTFAYMLPLLEKLYSASHSKGFIRRGQRTRALIVVPNRELGLQVLEVLKSLLARDKTSKFANFNTLLLSGGTDSFKHETQLLMPGLDVLISTPERLVNHIDAEHLYLDDLRTVIFDEADTLMSRPDATEKTLQFISYMKENIRERVTLSRVQHVFVSATVSKPLMDLLKREYRDIVSVVSASIHKSVPQLKQEFLYGAGGDFRFRLLLSTLQKRKIESGGRSLIFCNSVHTCKDVFTRLEKKGYSVTMLHSDLDVKRRKKGYDEFMHGDTRILIATDIASRGLDMGSRVKHVILYEFPTNTIDYLHRIGRTARAGQVGFVTALVGKQEQRLATLIKKTLEEGRSLAEITPTVPKEKRPAKKEKEEISAEYKAQWERSNPPKKQTIQDDEDDDFADDEDDFDDFDENEPPRRKAPSGTQAAKFSKPSKTVSKPAPVASRPSESSGKKEKRSSSSLDSIGAVIPHEPAKSTKPIKSRVPKFKSVSSKPASSVSKRPRTVPRMSKSQNQK